MREIENPSFEISSPELPYKCEHNHLSQTAKDGEYYCEQCGCKFQAKPIQMERF